jgi:hypothetical protein
MRGKRVASLAVLISTIGPSPWVGPSHARQRFGGAVGTGCNPSANIGGDSESKVARRVFAVVLAVAGLASCASEQASVDRTTRPNVRGWQRGRPGSESPGARWTLDGCRMMPQASGASASHLRFDGELDVG